MRLLKDMTEPELKKYSRMKSSSRVVITRAFEVQTGLAFLVSFLLLLPLALLGFCTTEWLWLSLANEALDRQVKEKVR